MSALAAHAGKIVAGALAAGFAAIAYDPAPGDDALDRLGARFAFIEQTLPSLGDGPERTVRQVHPRLQHIAGWISSVGASVALSDLDADGLANDYCLVDPRRDSVTVGPVPGSGDRYPAFVMPTPSAGFDAAAIAPMGCLPADVDADGRMDLVVYYWGRTPVVFRAIADRPAADAYRMVAVTAETIPWFTNAAIFADIDGDGHGDLMFGNYFADGAGILDTSGSLPIDMQHSMSRAANAGTNRLLLNSGAATGAVGFRDATASLTPEMVNGWTLALGAADLDGDHRPEIYVANDFGPDRLLHNRSEPGDPSFAVVEGRRHPAVIRSATLGRDSFKGMGIDFADLDGDGRLDLYVSNIAEDYALIESHFLFLHTGADDAWRMGRAPYRNASGRLGLARSAWSWDGKLADFDNDGRVEAVQTTGFLRGEADRWPELHELAMANDEVLRHPAFWPVFASGADISGDQHDRFFVADEAGVYRDLAERVGLGGASVSRAIALGDVDGDGDLDLAIARQWQASSFYLNEQMHQNAALVLDLRLRTANGATRPAIGAVARLVASDGRPHVGFVDGGNGHGGRRSHEIHFGLGAHPPEAHVDVVLSWRDGGGVHSREVSIAPGRHRIILDDVALAGGAVAHPTIGGRR